MPAWIEAREVETLEREQLQAPVQLCELVQVQQQHEDAVAQRMAPGLQPGVRDDPGIEPGSNHYAATSSSTRSRTWMRPDSPSTVQGRRTPPSCSATARPDCR